MFNPAGRVMIPPRNNHHYTMTREQSLITLQLDNNQTIYNEFTDPAIYAARLLLDGNNPAARRSLALSIDLAVNMAVRIVEDEEGIILDAADIEAARDNYLFHIWESANYRL